MFIDCLGIEAINRGYRVSFIQMNELIRLLKTEEISRNSRAKVKRMIGSDLVIIDDLMFMAIDRHEANLFFQLINQLYGQTSIIVTSNKGPEEWGDIKINKFTNKNMPILFTLIATDKILK